ncbi:MAG: type II toxin-antitoxin system HicA family toxin [Candidatus Aminicenantes bacterium]|nr:type II toxin-antitoxin system HicA family toxin [Candidatus Aminicenantes bacterium]
MKYPKQIWNQIKNISVEKLITALNRDGWVRDEKRGASLIYRRNKDRITVHYHPKKTYQPNLLKGMLDKIGWNEKDLRRLKLIK